MFRELKAILTVDVDDPDLVQAQFAAFMRQLPLLHLVLLTQTISLAATHINAAPFALAVLAPAMLCGVSLYRLTEWAIRRNRRHTLEQAIRQLRSSNRVAALFGGSFCLWGLLLTPYGNASQQAHIGFYIATMVVSAMFCLMHLRGAAITLMATVLIPFVTFLVVSGEPVYLALAVNITLVSAVIVFILFVYYRDFRALIRSQRELTERQVETQRLSDQNYHLANSDSLTGLPNRRCFRAELEKRIRLARENGTSIAVGVIDLDGFKPVNDAFGHQAGDRLLVAVADRLTQLVDEGLHPSRIGGDEFGLIFDPAPSPEDLQRFGDRVCLALEEPYVFDKQTARISGSLGIALLADDYTGDGLFDRADYALRITKQSQRGTALVFSPEHEANVHEQGVIEQTLRAADLRAEICLVFQPIVDAETSAILSYEALARWRSFVLGPVRPDVFITAAERTGIVSRLTVVVTEKALDAIAGWPAPVRLAINLSTHDIMSSPTVDRLIALIAESGIDPARLDFEVTETAVIRNYGIAVENLRRLAAHGVGIALDDFGTGHASLSYIQKLPLTKIKIDRSLVVDVATSATIRSIIKTVIDLSHSIGCDCVVEGMETDAQVRALRKLGCRMMQGYYFSAPQTFDDTLAHHRKAGRGIAKTG